MADIGMAQIQSSGQVELPLLTAGNDLNQLQRILKGKSEYSAADVIDYILADLQNLPKPLSASPDGEDGSDSELEHF